MKPRIGITSGLEGVEWLEQGASFRAYSLAVESAGGQAVRLDPGSLGRESAVLAGLEGVLFTGGKDIHLSMFPNPPELNGEDVDTVMARARMRPEPARDAYELPLLQEALSRDMPVLGICRGCQLLNVGLGGRLILDIPSEVDTPIRHRTDPAPDGRSSRHGLEVLPGTMLAAMLGPGSHEPCNSRHHQAVREDAALAAVVAARAPDGLVEAIEVRGRRWAIGVQWHPEHPHDPDVREKYVPLFLEFIRAAS